MNADKEKALLELTRRNPFWVCSAVFLLLACDYAFRMANQVEQRRQLDQARLMQAQNYGVVQDAQQLETRLQAFSLDLLQVAKTNAAASQIVREFNIQWNPAPGTAPPVAPVPAQPLPQGAAATAIAPSPPTPLTNAPK